jgi:hypothetical protein
LCAINAKDDGRDEEDENEDADEGNEDFRLLRDAAPAAVEGDRTRAVRADSMIMTSNAVSMNHSAYKLIKEKEN